MELMDSYCAIVGIIAIGVGLYELFTKQLVGRKDLRASKAQILKFLPIDAATYIVDGALLTLMGMGNYFPFVAQSPVIIGIIIASLAVIALNVYFSRKML